MEKMIGRFTFTEVELKNGHAHRFLNDFIQYCDDVKDSWSENWRHENDRWHVTLTVYDQQEALKLT